VGLVGCFGVGLDRVVVVGLSGSTFLGCLVGWVGSVFGFLCFVECVEEEGDAGGGEGDDEGDGLWVEGCVAVYGEHECGGDGSRDEAAGGAGEEGGEPLGVHVLPESVQPLRDGLPGGVLGGSGGV